MRVVAFQYPTYTRGLRPRVVNSSACQWFHGNVTPVRPTPSHKPTHKCIHTDVNAVTRTWGVEVTRVEVSDIEPSPDIVKAMELQMSAERHKRAAILNSEAAAISAINDANGAATALRAAASAEKDAAIMKAEAIAEGVSR